jgi:hypothetical protein
MRQNAQQAKAGQKLKTNFENEKNTLTQECLTFNIFPCPWCSCTAKN